MKLNFWQILGLVLIVAAILYTVFKRADESRPSTVPPSLTPEMTTQPT